MTVENSFMDALMMLVLNTKLMMECFSSPFLDCVYHLGPSIFLSRMSFKAALYLYLYLSE